MRHPIARLIVAILSFELVARGYQTEIDHSASFTDAASPGEVSDPAQLVFLGAAGCDGDDTAGCARTAPEGNLKVVWGFSMTADGSLTPTHNLTVDGIPAWLTAAPQAGPCLFATLVDIDSVAAFSVSASGVLQQRGKPLKSGGVNPVYASVTADGKTLLVANYHGPDNATSSGGASVAAFRIGSDCSLTAGAVVEHSGASIVHGRQDSAHPHSFVAAAEGSKAYACDLGQDMIFTYEVGEDGQSLKELHRSPTRKGDGPRHLVHHPTKPFLYVVNELGNTVSVYEEDGDGALELKMAASTLSPTWAGNGTKAAEIAMSPDGSIIYATNRGVHNTVCVFSVGEDGSLQQVQQVSAPSFPRGMVLAPGGSHLLVAGQHLGVVDVFRSGNGKGARLSRLLHEAEGPPTVATLAFVASPAGLAVAAAAA